MKPNLKLDQFIRAHDVATPDSDPPPDDGWRAFAAELVSLTPALRLRALMFLHDGAAADDLVQDTLERALSHRHLFQRGTSLAAWTNSIIRNLFVDGWRRNARFVEVDPEQLEIDPHQPCEPGPLDVFGAADVHAALAGLRPREREIFEMGCFGRLCHREIAARFNVHVSTVGTSLYRTRAKLRKALIASLRAHATTQVELAVLTNFTSADGRRRTRRRGRSRSSRRSN